jgi:hypothetical protein
VNYRDVGVGDLGSQLFVSKQDQHQVRMQKTKNKKHKNFKAYRMFKINSENKHEI